MNLNDPKLRRIFFIATAAIIVGGFLFWMSDLSSDPPMYYSGLGQSLSTDPVQYFYHARNKLLFGEFDPFDYPRWIVYQRSITSIVSYLWMSLVGVSTAKAGMVGLFLCFGALIFFILGIARHHNPWVTTAVALCFVINVTLLTYGRLTYLENGLIFLSSLVFYVYSRWSHNIWGIATAGALVAVAMLMGKLFGAMLLPGLLLAIFFAGRQHRWKKIAYATSSFIVTALILIMVLYGTNLKTAFSYIGEQAYGLRGFPEGLSSPLGFVEHFVSYGLSNRLFYLDPDIFMFLIAGGIALMFYRSRVGKISNLSPVAMLSIFWVVMIFLGLMPLNYSPVRYAVIMLPLILIGCFSLLESIYAYKGKTALLAGKFQLVLSGTLIWLLAFHLIGNLFYFNVMPHPVRMITWGTLPFAIIVVFLVYRLAQKQRICISRKMLTYAIMSMLVLSVISNSFRIRRLHYLDHNFNLQEANLDIEQILGPDAVVSGPYGPVLTVNTRLKSFIHLFGVATVDTTLFDRYPITHLAVDASNWEMAIRDYPRLVELKPVTSYWIRDYEVQLFNISKVFENPEAQRYQETDYEKSLASFFAEQPDSAFALASQFVKKYPYSKSGSILLIDLLSDRKQFDRVYDLLLTLAEKYPTDFFIQAQCGRFLQMLAFHQQNHELLVRAHQYYEKAVRVNRYKADYASALYAQTARELAAGG